MNDPDSHAEVARGTLKWPASSSASTWGPPTRRSPMPRPSRPATLPPAIKPLPIPQLVATGEVGERSVLAIISLFALGQGIRQRTPSTCRGRKGADRVVGTFARDQGAKVPGRLVGLGQELALARAGSIARAPILPWGAADDVARRSRRSTPRPPTSRIFATPGTHASRGEERHRPARTSGRDPHRPRLVRRRRSRVDRRGGPGVGPGKRHAPRRAPGRVLRLAQRLGRGSAGESGSRSATSCWFATSAAARPTSP